ncbi:MAG: zf-HC2 domain-containing protein [Armatimonadetes bacterium]|nr:zf-HC2 domain-containing protein [Armatimonadota bacterium]
MDCRAARDEMHRLLDHGLRDRAPLDAHLADCEACRRRLASLRRLDESLRGLVSAPPDDAALDRAAAAALRRVEAERVRVPPRRLALVPAVFAGLVLAFAFGVLVGRAVWPRERVVTRVVEKRVPVKVIREVPVVRTRVVYRDRVVRVPQRSVVHPEPASAGEPRAPVKLAEIVVRLDARTGEAPSTVVSRELADARTVDDAAPDPRPAQPERAPGSDATGATPAAGLRFAAVSGGAHQP